MSQTTFNIGTGFNGAVHAAVFRPDGYLYVSGDFTTYQGSSAVGICRIKPSGALDTNFTPSGFTVDSTYYPPSQLLPTEDGGVVCVLAKTYTKLLKGGGVFTKMKFGGNDVAPIIKLTQGGALDSTPQFDCSVGDVVAAATLVRSNRICYIKVANPTLVRMIRYTDLMEYRLSCAMAGAFNDVSWTGFHDGRIVLSGPTQSAYPSKTLTASVPSTTSYTNWPHAAKVMVLDETLTPSQSWLDAVTAVADTDAYNILVANDRLYVGQKLVVNTSHGQWNGDTVMQDKGMYSIGFTGYSEWDLHTGNTPTEEGFEPYQDGNDDDGNQVVSIALAAHPTNGRVYVTAPFGTFRNGAITRYMMIPIKLDGTLDSGFTCPALTDAGTARIACASVSPSGQAVFVGGRFSGQHHATVVNATTGTISTALQVVIPPQMFAYTGAGVRGLVWSGFGEGVYVSKPDK